MFEAGAASTDSETDMGGFRERDFVNARTAHVTAHV
jgi:hypothetical protein